MAITSPFDGVATNGMTKEKRGREGKPHHDQHDMRGGGQKTRIPNGGVMKGAQYDQKRGKTGKKTTLESSSSLGLVCEPISATTTSKPTEQREVATEQHAQDVLPADVLKQLRQKITDACELLEFAIAEGVQVSDKIIIDIAKAQELLAPNSHPSWSDWATFTKTYRDMAHSLGPMTVETARAKTLGKWIKEHPIVLRVVIGVSAMVLLGLLFFLLVPFGGENYKQYAQYGLMVLGSVPLTAFILWILSMFTGVATNRKLNQMIYFCYIFLILALALWLLPFFGFNFIPNLEEIMVKTPLGVIQGCHETSTSQNSGITNSTIPQELRCGENNRPSFQWVINIGGMLSLEHPPAQSRPQESGTQSGTAGNQERRLNTWKISGGIVVPLYVVLLSWMGSAVSMTRRIPEYQRRALDPKEAFANAQARENLIFQIMQVLSAPLIVITVYYLFKPDTPAVSVLLGFASGFASEPILLAIRRLVEKLSPATTLPSTTETAPVTVTVTPATYSLQAGQSHQFLSAVTPATANANVQWSIEPPAPDGGVITQTGLYTAPQQINGHKTVTITACSTADRTKSGSATVNLAQEPKS
jgi:uncharacterized protein YjdB